MSTTTKVRNPMSAIFLTALIDMIGIGIIIPVIPAIFFKSEVQMFSADTSDATRSIMYGILVASYPFMQFFGAPMLGALADRFGRKPVLLVSLFGTLIGYLLFGLALYMQSLPLLFISRMLPGFFGGNISILMSAISDVSTNETRTKNFGFIGMAFGLGFILGPFIGGILADNTVVSWFTHSTPFQFTAILTLINIALVWYNFGETLAAKSLKKLSPLDGLVNIKTAFTDPKLRIIFTVVLLVGLGFTFFTQFFSAYLYQRFGYSEKSIGLLFGWIGLWLAITQGFFVRKFTGAGVRASQVLPISLLFLGIFVASLTLVGGDGSFFYLVNPLIAISQGMSAPYLTTLVSMRAGAERQGQILGLNQSMQSLGQVFPPLIAGWLNTLNPVYPIWAGTFFILLGWVVYVVFFKEKTSPVNE